MATTTPLIASLGELQKSAQTYQQELLVMPVISAEQTLQHMSARPGTVGRRLVGTLLGDVELRPYAHNAAADGGFSVAPRTLETFLGVCAHDFAPNDIWDTVYGSAVVQGNALKDVEVSKAILLFAAAQLGKKLNASIWNAARKDDGTTTADLFNGFDTITSAEIEDGNIAASKGNYIASEFDAANAVDWFKAVYAAASDELQGAPVKIFCSKDQYRAYLNDYKVTTGGTPYNTEYRKTFLEGSDDLAEFVPLANKKGSPFIHIAPQANMLYGYGNGLAQESVNVEKYKPWVLTLEAAMYFGVQFESLQPERLFVVNAAKEETPVTPPDND